MVRTNILQQTNSNSHFETSVDLSHIAWRMWVHAYNFARVCLYMCMRAFLCVCFIHLHSFFKFCSVSGERKFRVRQPRKAATNRIAEDRERWLWRAAWPPVNRTPYMKAAYRIYIALHVARTTHIFKSFPVETRSNIASENCQTEWRHTL
jgi:hypothetical protein